MNAVVIEIAPQAVGIFGCLLHFTHASAAGRVEIGAADRAIGLQIICDTVRISKQAVSLGGKDVLG